MNGGVQQRGVSDPGEDRALDALALAWGAWREGAGDEDVLAGSTPEELNRAIRAHWAREGTR